jgi:hypothetical protein
MLTLRFELFDLYHYLTLLGELNGIADQVGENLP